MKKSYYIVPVMLLFLSLLLAFSNFLILFKYNEYFIFPTAHASNQGTVSLVVEGNEAISPTISMVYPTLGSYTSHITAINYTAADNNVLNSCWYSLNQGTTNVSVVCGVNITGITSSEGTNTWKVYANDSFGNQNSSSVSFDVDIPAEGGGSTGGGGSGGGGGSSAVQEPAEFDVYPEELNVLIISKQTDSRKFKIKNTGDNALVIDMEVSGIAEFASLDKERVTLSPGEEETVSMTFTAPESGIYAGRVILKSGNIRRDLFVIMNVRSEDALFDVSLSLPDSFKVILIGDVLKTFISLLQVGEAGEVDVTIKYIIKDFDGETLSSESETFRVFREKSFVKEFSTSELKEGDYIVGIDISYPGGFASSSAHFSVRNKWNINPWLVTTIILAFLAASVIIYSAIRYKRTKRNRLR